MKTRKIVFRGTILIVIVFLAFFYFFKTKKMTINIASPVFQNGGNIPQKYTCQGENINPPLVISNIPAKAKSLVLIVDDPDAPGGVWNHWLVWNINPHQEKINEDSLPEGAITGINDFGKAEYGGPCPPSGVHRYFFRLYALNARINLSAGAKRSNLDQVIRGKIISQGELMGKYSAQK